MLSVNRDLCRNHFLSISDNRTKNVDTKAFLPFDLNTLVFDSTSIFSSLITSPIDFSLVPYPYFAHVNKLHSVHTMPGIVYEKFWYINFARLARSSILAKLKKLKFQHELTVQAFFKLRGRTHSRASWNLKTYNFEQK